MTGERGTASSAASPQVVLDRDDAVAVLFRRHSTDLVGLAFCLIGDREAAEEVVQDGFVALHRALGGAARAPPRSPTEGRGGQRVPVEAAAARAGETGHADIASADHLGAESRGDRGAPG